MTDYKEYATKAEALAEVQAIDKALGNPQKPAWVGTNAAQYVPSEYVEGAIGWTKTECVVDEHAGGTALVALTQAAVALGRQDVVVKGKTISLDMGKDLLSAKPARFEAGKEEPVKVGDPKPVDLKVPAK